MISRENEPLAWAMLMYELEDAQEHLTQLVSKINHDADYDEENFRIDLEHIYSHLNRAWYRRNKADDLSDDEWLKASRFPDDLVRYE